MKNKLLSTAVYIHEPSSWEVEAGGSKFKVIVGYVVSLKPFQASWKPWVQTAKGVGEVSRFIKCLLCTHEKQSSILRARACL